jgi:polysaccharide export outer membrane protein
MVAMLTPGLSAAEGVAKSPRREASHKLQPMDLVKIQIFQEPDLERELRVSEGYAIVAPLIGAVDVKGRTVREVEVLITELYNRDYLVNPQVNLTVVEYAQRSVNVLGAVNSPGSISSPPEKEMNLLDAIARAGGFSRLANRDRVSLTRTLPNGETANYSVNCDKLMVGDSVSRWPVQEGDIITVPERVL